MNGKSGFSTSMRMFHCVLLQVYVLQSENKAGTGGGIKEIIYIFQSEHLL
jgi:hypothetical protein